MIYQIDERLKRRLQEEMAGVKEHITAGRLASFEDYKYYAGVLRGLSAAETIVDELLSKIKEG